MVQKPSSQVKPVTSVLNWNSTPLSNAFSASAIVRLNGQTMPPVGAQSAATACFDTFGSSSCRRFASTISSSLTPFFTPFSYSARSFGRSSSDMQTTSEPFILNAKSRSFASCGIIRLPSRFIFAIRLPCAASKPAWTMALLALEVPQHTSSAFSSTSIRPS